MYSTSAYDLPFCHWFVLLISSWCFLSSFCFPVIAWVACKCHSKCVERIEIGVKVITVDPKFWLWIPRTNFGSILMTLDSCLKLLHQCLKYILLAIRIVLTGHHRWLVFSLKKNLILCLVVTSVMYFFFAAERARYADIRCSANFKLVLSNNLKKNDNANWNNYTQKIDHEDN